MKTRWKLSDIIDLEYFLARDRTLASRAGEDALKERDRGVFINEIAEAGPHTLSWDRGILTRKWLDAMRQREDANSDTALPGRLWKEVYNLFALGITGAGLITGSALALSLLSYSGKTPVNVFLFLAVLVLPQMALLISMLALYAGRKLLKRDASAYILVSLLMKLFGAVARRISRLTRSSVSEQDILNLQAISGCIRAGRKIYGNIFFWPFFILLQLFGVGFNAGALAATLFKVAGSDLAFGWQSTLQVSAETVASIVSAMALPWSWFMAGACPGIEQIEGSRMILKEGIYHLSTSDLTSWWPFLCMCLLFYGLIPRLALLAWGRIMFARSLSGLRFSAARFRDIERRMTMPSVRSSGETVPDQGCGIRREHETETRLSAPVIKSRTDSVPDSGEGTVEKHRMPRAVLLIPDEILDILAAETVSEACRRLGLDPSVALEIEEPCDLQTDPCGRELRACFDSGAGPDTIVLVQEAWQPPIQEMVHSVQAIRNLAGNDCLILIGLVGQTGPDGSIMPVREQDFAIWHQKIKTLGDPGLQVKELLKT